MRASTLLVLSQENHPVYFASRTLNDHEINYSMIEKMSSWPLSGQRNISDPIYLVEAKFKTSLINIFRIMVALK